MRRRSLVASATTAATAAIMRPRQVWPTVVTPAAGPIDLLLVLAVDVSPSIEEDEARLQQEGYRAALTDVAVLAAIEGGEHGAIGLAYVEWAGIGFQRLLIPWTRIARRADTAAWAERLAAAYSDAGSPADHSRGWERGSAETVEALFSGTSISRGIDYSVRTLARAPWQGVRRVIDVSGDGVNNSGWAPEEARDKAVRQGITINGLAVEGLAGKDPLLAGARLADYYRDAVIGGPGAFVVEAAGLGAFREAVQRKLVREIANLIGTDGRRSSGGRSPARSRRAAGSRGEWSA